MTCGGVAVTVLVLMVVVVAAEAMIRINDYETPQYLRQSVRQQLEKAKSLQRHHGIAKNLILVVGDGMGISTLTAGRIYVGQTRGETGEENKLSFEEFPAVGLSKTYNLDSQVPDSAGTATAMLSGLKVNIGTLGVDGRVPYGEACEQLTEDRKILSVLDYALQEGKSVGIVTNTRVTHATPGAAYAHVPYRDWESDPKMAGISGCDHVKDIAYQLVMDNPNINVVLGGGRRHFLRNTTTDPGTGKVSSHQRQDGLDLIEEWKKDKSARGLRHQYVDTKGALNSVDAANTDYLFGLFSSSHMDYEANRNDTDNGQPSLVDMAKKALEILKKNEKGFFLLLEGGRIDHAHHDNLAKLSMMETDMLDKAVRTLVEETPEKDTLITVTADHSHVFTMAGYPSRGNDIFGTVDMVSSNGPADGLPYLTLSYTNGPGGREATERANYTNVNTSVTSFVHPADVKLDSETHGGEDVAIFSRGPMSHLFHTSHDQSYIGHVMMYAACLGDYADDKDCDRLDRLQKTDPQFCAGIRHLSSACLLLSVVMVTVLRHLL